MDSVTTAERNRRLTGRLRFVRVVAWLMVPVTAVGLFGIADLMTLPGWVDQRYVWAVPLEASWGSLVTFVVAGSYVSIARNPRDPWPGSILLGVAALSIVLSAVLGADARPLPLALIIAVPALGLLVAGRRDVRSFTLAPSLSLPYLAVAAAAVPLWLPYSLHAFQMSRLEPDAGHVTWGIEHWPVQGAAGLTFLAAALVAAGWRHGRPLLRISTSLSAVYIGAAMLAYPDRAGAMESPMWGVAMVLWGTVVALLPDARRPTMS
ncbi:hypothetical protein AB0P28_04030 [Pseudarthrobacter sp. NPDC089323]